MSDNPLKVVEVQKGLPHRSHSTNAGTLTSHQRDAEAKARFEREWLLYPESFDPGRNAIERERIDRTWKLIKPLMEVPELQAADLGFGWGVLTRKMQGRGGLVDAVDIAENALKHFTAREPCAVNLSCDGLPRSSLADDRYDLVVCTDLIAELETNDQRLLISELYRILKPSGFLVCSTSLDYRTDGALERFAALIDTEFEVIEWEVSHHAYALKLINLFKALGLLFKPLKRLVQNSRTFTLFLESICRAISPDRGVSHAICVAKLKSINTTAPIDIEKMEPQNQRIRQRVWE